MIIENSIFDLTATLSACEQATMPVAVPVVGPVFTSNDLVDQLY